MSIDIEQRGGEQMSGSTSTADGPGPTVVVPRDRDGRLAKEDRDQRRVQPDSLLWKYWADRRMGLVGFRIATTENMYPQLGQAVSDHSVIFTSLYERVQRSTIPITNSLYGAEPEKIGIRVRNYHKPLTGTVQDGSRYHGTAYSGLDPETFYWAHATFVDGVFTCVERFIKKLSDAEKEQLFQETRDWYSLWGVEDSYQPQTYAEFVEYWDRNVREELIGDSRVARYTVGYIKKGITRAFPTPKGVPPIIWNRVIAPMINAFTAFLGAGGLDPIMRQRLGVDWTPKQQKRYDRFAAVVRALGPLWERAPLTWRYGGAAVDAFRREGVDPRRIGAASAVRQR